VALILGDFVSAKAQLQQGNHEYYYCDHLDWRRGTDLLVFLHWKDYPQADPMFESQLDGDHEPKAITNLV
jgi:hypothetical protein